MMKRSFFLLFVGFLVCYSFSIRAMPNFISQGAIDTHILTATIDLKPISSLDKAYQTAAICFLGSSDCQDEAGFKKGDSDMSLDPVTMCKDDGYTTTVCTKPKYPSDMCPHHGDYYRTCSEDTARACQESGYVGSCGTGQVADTSQKCPYNSSYTKCKCDPCDGYTYTYAQATAEGYVADGSCNSCGTLKYKRKNNPCSGFLTCNCGGETGTATCKSGTATKYKVCKTCCPAGITPGVYGCKTYYDSPCNTVCKESHTDNCHKRTEVAATNGCLKYFDDCDSKCEIAATNCARGDILYSNKMCSNKVISGMTPIGVIFDATNKMATALTETSMKWGELDVSVIGQRVQLSLTDGKFNTQFLKNQSKSYPAAEYAASYTTAGTTAGEWFLGTQSQMNSMSNGGINAVNNTLTLLGKPIITTDGYWTSSPITTAPNMVYIMKMGGGVVGYDGNEYFKVRPMIDLRTCDDFKAVVRNGSVGCAKYYSSCPTKCELHYVDCKNNTNHGSFLYSDRTCSFGAGGYYDEPVPGKIPVGITFPVEKPDGSGNIWKAVALKSFSQPFGGEGYDIPTIENCVMQDGHYRGCQYDQGKINTKKIIDYGRANGITYDAAEQCYNYTTAGTNVGDWYLPTLNDISRLRFFNSTINDAFRRATESHSSTVLVGTSWYFYYWTSNEFSANEALNYYGKPLGGSSYSLVGEPAVKSKTMTVYPIIDL